MMRKWINTEPGVLQMEGTDFRIVYKGDLTVRLFYGVQKRKGWSKPSLYQAKQDAERHQDELEEVGWTTRAEGN